jgi:signal transduction histidine kinase
MLNVTREISSSDDLSKRIPVDTRHNDEMNELALTFNQTLVRLERLFKAQRRFLADVSHELRTPLTVIKGNVGLMRMTKSIDEESLDSISSEADRLTRLVGDLLLISQAESGNLPLMEKPVELDQLLFEVFEEMKILSEGKHDIQIDYIEPTVITGDRDRLKQVFLNLGSNAVKYSPEGTKITLSLQRKREWVEVVVRDEGYGIPKEELGRLFERFYRGDKSRTRSKSDVGYGLGLPIAYWIVRSHKGRIDVDTEVNQGTTFTVRLPSSNIEVPTRPLRSRQR